MEDIIKKIEQYQEQNDVSFKFVLAKNDFMEIAADLGFLIGQMNSQLATIKNDIENGK